jgi:hypothetical protein
MKHKGNTINFIGKRNSEIMSAFRKAIADTHFIDREKAYAAVANSTYSRFWVSEERAYTVVRDILKGRPRLFTMLPSKREMFEEIYRRVCIVRTDNPELPLSEVVWGVVNSPAPKLYMTTSTIETIIYRTRSGWDGKPQPRMNQYVPTKEEVEDYFKRGKL